MPDNIPTMIVRPDPKQEGQGGSDPAATSTSGGDKAGGAKLSRDQLTGLIKQEMPGLSPAGTEGVVRNIMRESKGDAGAIGDGGTSGGLFQHHNTRLTDLKGFAEKAGKDWKDPAVQVRFAASELKKNYPTLLAQLQRGDDPAETEDAFKRVFERPASIMWANKPKTEAPGYRFSDYALGEHAGRKNTDLVHMSPVDYLDLSPHFEEEEPRASAKGQSLRRSLDNGDEVEAIPTLDMQVRGKTGMVTDQDGRHRALAAQDAGIESIPVAIRTPAGSGQPTEIQGLSGMVLPYDFPKAKDAPKRDDPSPLWKRAMDAIIPSAEAAEPSDDPFAHLEEAKKPDAQPTQRAATKDDSDPFAQLKPEADGALVSGLKGAAAGLGRTVLSGEELLGKGIEAASDAVSSPGDDGKRGMVGRAGEWLTADARKGIAGLDQAMAPDKEAHPWATAAGEMMGAMAIPGGIAGKVTTNALRGGALAGGLNAMLSTEGGKGPDGKDKDDSEFWSDKAIQTLGGTALGGAFGKAGDVVGGMIAPRLNEAVRTLMREGVQLTPGQMKGGYAKRAEDIMANVPGVGSQIRTAQKRSFETFNRAAINRSLADINTRLSPEVIGHDAIAEAEQQFRTAYNTVIPSMRGIRDPAFMGELNHIISRAHAQGTPSELPPEYINRLRFAIQSEIIDRFDANGHISGDLAQDVGTRLDTMIRAMGQSDNPYSQNVGRALREADHAFDRMMAAHNPLMQAAKSQIDAGYAKFKTVQRAASSAGADPDGTFTPSQLSGAVRARDRSKDKAAFARGDALLQDLAAAGRAVLPQKVGDSGTAERALLLAGLGGAAHFDPHSAALAAAAMVPYTAPVSRGLNMAVNRLLQQPGPTRNALATLARRGGQMGGAIAGGESARNLDIPTMTIRPDGRTQ